MPGERLTCVWQAAYCLNPDTHDASLTKKSLHDVVLQLADLSTISYSRNKFDDVFKSDNDVTVQIFRQYLFEKLAIHGTMQCQIQEEVEGRCWELCKKIYSRKSMSESNIKKLWEISNRLTEVDTFPPVLCQGVVDWFVEKIGTHLGKLWKIGTQKELRGYSFGHLLDNLVDEMFANQTEEAVTICIQELHDWLVREVMKTGWLYRRAKKQANWTNWSKKWFVLSSTRLLFFDGPSHQGQSKKRGEVFLTGCKLENLPPYKGVVHKLQGRFKLSCLPYLEVELATESFGDRRSWVTYIEETLNAARNKTTPIQSLLLARWGANKQNAKDTNQSNSKLNKIEKTATENAAIIIPHSEDTVSQKVTMRKKFKQMSVDSSPTGSEDESFDNAETSNLISASNEKMKAVFMRIDQDGNGKIDLQEFGKFISGLGLSISPKEINLLFKSIEKNNHSFITFQEFADYFENVLLDETVEGKTETKLRGAFLKADRDGTGTLNFKEFAEYIWDKKRSIRMSRLIDAFDNMDQKNQGQVSYNDFRNFYKNRMSTIPETESYQDGAGLNTIDDKLKEFYNNAESKELANFIRDRWNKFASFKRYGASGQLAMKGGHGMVDDIVPGEYSLLDLALFSDLPPLVPKHTVIKGIQWQSSTTSGKSGKLIFPRDFDGTLVSDAATPEHLRYYGCSFAEGNQLKISLLYRHGIQDFTYENQYLDDYVKASNGGSGVERHEFSHLDCPLEENSGNFILAKLVGDDEIHLTAFHVPIRHTLYIPSGVIHSNDYLKGTWRTMLSDEADIDHVHLVRGTPPKDLENFQFQFVS